MSQFRILLDSNILIRWVEPDQPDQIIVARALGRLQSEYADLCYTSQNLGEFWNALTRPTNRNGYGLSPAQAHLRARAVESKITLLPDTPDVHTEWRKLLVTHCVSGTQVHDTRLVASMHIHGVERILTFNKRDFARFPDIKTVNPADLS